MPAAAAQCVASTAWSMVTSVAAIRPGETVLVPSASGGVAGAAVQAAVIAGARVIASVGAPEKADAVPRARSRRGVLLPRDARRRGRRRRHRRPRRRRRRRHHRRAPLRRAPGGDGARRAARHLRRARRRGRPARHHRALPPRAPDPRVPGGDARRDPNGARDGARRPDLRARRSHVPARRGGRRRTPTWPSAATSGRSCWCHEDGLLPGPLPAERQREGGGRRALRGRLDAGAGAASQPRLHDPPDAVPGAGLRRHPPLLGGARAVRHAGVPAPTAAGWPSPSRRRSGPISRTARG